MLEIGKPCGCWAAMEKKLQVVRGGIQPSEILAVTFAASNPNLRVAALTYGDWVAPDTGTAAVQHGIEDGFHNSPLPKPKIYQDIANRLHQV